MTILPFFFLWSIHGFISLFESPFRLQFQRLTALQNNFSHGDMAVTIEGTLVRFLCEIGSILGPK